MSALTQFSEVRFDVAGELLERGVRVAVFVMSGLRNQESHPEFEGLQAESVRSLLAGLSQPALRTDPILQGFRDLHTALGFSNRTYPAASEVLLESLLRNGRLPHINLLVDIYNLVSVETRLALGAHDLEKISGNVHLKSTTGSEGFLPLGAGEPKPVRPGGYAYIDDANDVICLLEVKQVEKTKVSLATTEGLFILQGNAQTGPETVQAAAGRLAALLQLFCGGQVRFLYPAETQERNQHTL
jgi:DNA/RNA-binding domain of Phe-tRNA-synthetase-like protein